MSSTENKDSQTPKGDVQAGSTPSTSVLGRFRDPEKAREAAYRSAQVRREKAELRAQAPRDVAAAVLMRKAETWAQAVERQLDAAANGDTKAFQAILRLIPEGFGKVGEAEAEAADSALSFTVEQRQRLKALLLGDAVEGDALDVPEGNVQPTRGESTD